MATTPTPTVRLITAATALAAAAVLAVYPVVTRGASTALPLTFAVLAVAALLAGLTAGRPLAIGAAVGLLGLEFAFQPGSGDHPTSFATAVYAGGLVLVAELAFWSHTAGMLTPTRRRIVRKAATTLIVALAAAATAALVAEGSHASLSGAWLEPLGVAAAVTATLLLVLLANHHTRAG